MVMESLGPLSHSVKPSLRNLGVHMGHVLSLDQHVNIWFGIVSIS